MNRAGWRATGVLTQYRESARPSYPATHSWESPGWLLATFAQLRLGELAALTRDRLDLDNCQVRVTDAKSSAGNRIVTFPVEIVPEMREHLAVTQLPVRRASFSSGRRAAGCAETTSTRSGAPHVPPLASLTPTFTTFAILAARSPRLLEQP